MARPYIGGSSAAVKDITAATTLYSSDHGKMCLINYDGNASITVNLPEKQAGLEIKFLFIAAMDAASSQIAIKAPSANDMVGTVATMAADQTGSYDTSGSHNQLQINDNVLPGSYVNFFCNGSKWYVNGMIYSDGTDCLDFAAV